MFNLIKAYVTYRKNIFQSYILFLRFVEKKQSLPIRFTEEVISYKCRIVLELKNKTIKNSLGEINIFVWRIILTSIVLLENILERLCTSFNCLFTFTHETKFEVKSYLAMREIKDTEKIK